MAGLAVRAHLLHQRPGGGALKPALAKSFDPEVLALFPNRKPVQHETR